MVTECINCHTMFDIKVHQPRNLPYVPKVCSGLCLAGWLHRISKGGVDYDYDKPTAFRSKYEEAFASWLTKMGIPWCYEDISFLTKANTLYIPDFWLPAQGIIVEVKGLWENSNGKGSFQKFKEFVKKFQIQTMLVDKPLLRRLGCQIR